MINNNVVIYELNVKDCSDNMYTYCRGWGIKHRYNPITQTVKFEFKTEKELETFKSYINQNTNDTHNILR